MVFGERLEIHIDIQHEPPVAAATADPETNARQAPAAHIDTGRLAPALSRNPVARRERDD